MIPGIPSAKCTRGPGYTRGGSRQLRYFSTLTHSLPIIGLARELRYEWSSSLFLLHCVSLVLYLLVLSLEGGLPLYLYMKERRCCGYAWREAHAPLPSTWRHATTTWRRGQAAPVGGQPPLDHCLWPPPSRGRPWARPTLLPSGVLLRLSWIDRRLCHSFTWFSV
jgi:hypothetical protein